MTLDKYKQKRHFNKTSEPKPGPKAKKGKYLVFVVHKHSARRLHYDLRLEMNGVLKSFAIPKGPSLDPALKRLAIMVEDHPFKYKDFEGVIPEGNYGAGKVEIWDRGFYSSPFSANKKESEKLLLKGLKKGDLKFVLAGEKLKGEFALIKIRQDEKSWLLIKKKDKFALAPEGRRSSMPHNVKPMLATAVKKPFNGPDWLFEIKWDGYRAIAEVGKNKTLLYSRNQLSLSNKYPKIVESLKKLDFEGVLDGEIVVVDKKGRSDFQMLQDFRGSGSSGHLIYYVFDILYKDGRDLTQLALSQRQEILKDVLPQDRHLRLSEHVKKEGVAFFNAAKKKGLEGIVAKQAESRYQAGVRSKQWLKIKIHLTQDCVITGFTAPRRSRQFFGSLILGVYDKNKLIYVGHSGGGFGGQDIGQIYDRLKPLISKKSPFEVKPPEDQPITWVKPKLVCEVAFTSWTKAGILRQPIFIRFRDDKSPREATLESASPKQIR
jgi:bifunctional non-homologous end joining protein LigD